MTEIVLRLHQVYTRGNFIQHVVHISGTRMTKAGIGGLLRGNNLGLVMRGLNTLHFFPLDQGELEISTGV